jgi:hypothetical protein
VAGGGHMGRDATAQVQRQVLSLSHFWIRMKLASSPTKPPASLPLSNQPSTTPSAGSGTTGAQTSTRMRTPRSRNWTSRSQPLASTAGSTISQDRPERAGSAAPSPG